MNREGIIIIICIGIVALFYLFRVDSAPVKEVLKQTPGVFNAIPDSLDK